MYEPTCIAILYSFTDGREIFTDINNVNANATSSSIHPIENKTSLNNIIKPANMTNIKYNVRTRDLAADFSGNVYVTNVGFFKDINSYVYMEKFDSNGKFITKWTKLG
jgi:hypothetical protein